jgi:RNA polymerase-binding transcription factor DksA
MARSDGFPKCTNCGLPIRVARGDAPGLCKTCAPARKNAPKERADGAPATTSSRSRRK